MPDQDILEHRDGENFLAFRIDKRRKRGEYYVKSTSSQYKHCEKIELVGFDRLPAGLYKDGFGFTSGGSRLLSLLNEHYDKKIAVKVIKSGQSKFDGRGRSAKLTINHADLTKLNETVRLEKRRFNARVAPLTASFASGIAKKVPAPEDNSGGFVPGELHDALGRLTSIDSLSKEDRDSAEAFLTQFLEATKGTTRSAKAMGLLNATIKTSQKVRLSKVIEDFKSKLQAQSGSEESWQQFLRQHILTFRNTYSEVLDKQSIDFDGKFPDFMLLDAFGYVDIYEIKKPTTTLLSYDKGRGNHYWSSESAKAIVQVEKYMHKLVTNADALTVKIRNKYKIDVNVVHPRGYIIAGQRTELSDQSRLDDFRVLCGSLKNVEFILYDDLVTSLEAFLKSLDGGEE